MAKNFLITIYTFSFLLFLSQATYACMCSFGSVEGNFSSSKAVFVGKVVKIQIAEEVSVRLLMKDSGTSELLKTPRWEKFKDKVQSVTLEVIESFKGATKKTFVLTTTVYNGGGSCGVPFEVGGSFLAFAGKTQLKLSKEEVAQPIETWTLEMSLKAEADEINKQLPPYQTNICAGTDRLRSMKEEIEEIDNFLKSGKWKEKEKLKTVILY